MGFFDRAKEKATDYIDKNPDKVNNVIDKGADFLDKQTKGKYRQQIHKGMSAAKQRLHRRDRRTPGPEGPTPKPGV